MTEQQFSKVSFKDAYSFILRGLVPALLFGALAALVAFFVVRDPVPTYRSTAILLATRPASGYSSAATVIEPSQVDPDVYRAAVMQGGLLENALARVMEGEALNSAQVIEWRRKVRVRVDEGLISGLVRVEVEDQDPELAAMVANAVADALLAWDRDRVGRNVQETVASLDRSLALLGAQLAVAESGDDIQAVQVLRATREQRAAQLRAAEAMRLSAVVLGLLEPFRAAEADLTPVNDRTVFVSTVALALGLLLTYIVLLLLRVTDPRVRRASDVVMATGHDVIVEVPSGAGSSGFSDAIGRLCVALPLPTKQDTEHPEGPSQVGEVFLFTAPSGTRERSLLARHAAAAYASGGWRVLLVDADLNEGVVSEVLPSAQRGSTLMGLLNGAEGLTPTTLSSNQGSSLDFIPVGAVGEDGGTVLLGRKIAPLLKAWRRSYEIVIIDAASLTESASALTTVAEVSGVVLVVTRMRTRLHALQQAVQSIVRSGAKGLHVALVEPSSERRQKQPAGNARTVGYMPAQPVAASRARVVERVRRGS